MVHSGESSKDRKICFCHDVSEGEIREAIERISQRNVKKKRVTLEEIQAETCASTGCGGCTQDVQEILCNTPDFDPNRDEG